MIEKMQKFDVWIVRRTFAKTTNKSMIDGAKTTT